MIYPAVLFKALTAVL